MSIKIKKSNRSKGTGNKGAAKQYIQNAPREILAWRNRGKKSIRRSRNIQEEKKKQGWSQNREKSGT